MCVHVPMCDFMTSLFGCELPGSFGKLGTTCLTHCLTFYETKNSINLFSTCFEEGILPEAESTLFSFSNIKSLKQILRNPLRTSQNVKSCSSQTVLWKFNTVVIAFSRKKNMLKKELRKSNPLE